MPQAARDAMGLKVCADVSPRYARCPGDGSVSTLRALPRGRLHERLTGRLYVHAATAMPTLRPAEPLSCLRRHKARSVRPATGPVVCVVYRQTLSPLAMSPRYARRPGRGSALRSTLCHGAGSVCDTLVDTNFSRNLQATSSSWPINPSSQSYRDWLDASSIGRPRTGQSG